MVWMRYIFKCILTLLKRPVATRSTYILDKNEPKCLLRLQLFLVIITHDICSQIKKYTFHRIFFIYSHLFD